MHRILHYLKHLTTVQLLDAFNQATQSNNIEIRIAAITVLAEQIQTQTNSSAKNAEYLAN